MNKENKFRKDIESTSNELASSVIDKAKHNYGAHLTLVNPNGTAENVYVASCFYYEAELLPLLPENRLVKIVDIGSGFGHMLRFLFENGYAEIGGVEIDPSLYRISTSYTEKYARFLVNEDAQSFLKERTDEFDVITLFDVIEHFSLDGAYELLGSVYNCLAKNGIAILRTPNMANILGGYSRYMDLTHQSAFTEQSLTQLIQAVGFSRVDLHLPAWNKKNPLSSKFKESAEFQKKIYQMQDRSIPRTFDKNIVICAQK